MANMDVRLVEPPRPKPIFDFSPFLTAPAVLEAARPFGRPQIVDIPETRTPSPLAPNIAPQTLQDLREHYVGDGTGQGDHGGQPGGKEIWESWKRGWDLWNNHYIEGRTAPVWIRGEYERIRKEMEEEATKRQNRSLRRLHRHDHHRGVPPITPPFYGDTAPATKPGKLWRKTKMVPRLVPSGRKNAVKTGRKVKTNMPISKQRALPGHMMEMRRAGETVNVIGTRPITEIVEMRRTVRAADWHPLSSWVEVTKQRLAGTDPEPRTVVELEPTETKEESYFMERQVMAYQVVDVVGTTLGALRSYAETTADAKAGKNMRVPRREGQEPSNVSQRPTMLAPVMEPYYSGTRVLTQDERVPVIQFEDVDVYFTDEVIEEDIMETRDVQEWVEENDLNLTDILDISDVDIEMDLSDDIYDDFALGPLDSIQPAPELRIPLARKVTNAQGESGGFRPMKLLDEYLVPDIDPQTGTYPDWYDSLQNTVWRPRRVGERCVKIDMDECFEDVSHRTELEVDGGIDCGRSPYPVLRSIVEYFAGNYPIRKKKIWDKVTGTIFNMPIKPVDADEILDARMARIKALYGDIYRDNRDNQRHDLFPLDIRRVRRVNDGHFQADVGTEALVKGEVMVRYPWHRNPSANEDIQDDDPWKVTPIQAAFRDVPPRTYPPVQSTAPETGLMPVFDQLWQEELQNDDRQHWRYFVTNLHGGTLIINGKEIKKGAIAGPLPRFAIIQSPGNQVSFWWGVGGRDWCEGRPDMAHTAASHWRTLRNMVGFQHVGLTTGQVWDYKIRERITRELTGNEYEDDAEWDAIKIAVPAIEAAPKAAVMLDEDDPIVLRDRNDVGFPLGTEVIQPDSFPTEEAEYKWIYTKANPIARAIADARSDNFLLPAGPKLFPGSNAPRAPPEVDLQTVALMEWNANKVPLMAAQRAAMAALQKEISDKKELDAFMQADVNKKRKAASDAQYPPPKRTFASLEQAVKNAQAAQDATAATAKTRAEEAALRAKVLEFDAVVAVRRAKSVSDANPSPPYRTEGEAYCAEREQEDGATLGRLNLANLDRIGFGLPPFPVPTGPAIRKVLDAWLIYKDANIKAQDARRVVRDKLVKDRLDANAKVEAARLGVLRLQGEAAAKQLVADAVAKAKADADAAALSLQQKNNLDRLQQLKLTKLDALEKQRLDDEQKAKDAAATAARQRLLQQQQLQDRQGQFALQQAAQQAAQEQARRVAEQRRLEREQKERDDQAERKKLKILKNPVLPPGTTKEELALQQDRDSRTEKVRASLEDKADSANLSVAAYLATLNWNDTAEKWIYDQVNNPRVPPKKDSSTPPPLPPGGPALAPKVPEPVHPFVDDDTLVAWRAHRLHLEDVYARALRAEATVKHSSALALAQAAGYIDEDVYAFNLATLLLPSDIPTPTPTVQDAVPDLPSAPAANAPAAVRNAYNAAVMARVAIQTTNRAKQPTIAWEQAQRMVYANRLRVAENWEMQARALETDVPVVVDITKTAPPHLKGTKPVGHDLGEREIFS